MTVPVLEGGYRGPPVTKFGPLLTEILTTPLAKESVIAQLVCRQLNRHNPGKISFMLSLESKPLRSPGSRNRKCANTCRIHFSNPDRQRRPPGAPSHAVSLATNGARLRSITGPTLPSPLPYRWRVLRRPPPVSHGQSGGSDGHTAPVARRSGLGKTRPAKHLLGQSVEITGRWEVDG